MQRCDPVNHEMDDFMLTAELKTGISIANVLEVPQP